MSKRKLQMFHQIDPIKRKIINTFNSNYEIKEKLGADIITKGTLSNIRACLKQERKTAIKSAWILESDLKQTNLDNFCKSIRTSKNTVNEIERYAINYVPSRSTVEVGDATENYVSDVLVYEGYIVDDVGHTGDKSDFAVHVPIDDQIIKKCLQIKTLIVKSSATDAYFVNMDHKYDDDMLIVMVNKERTRFALDFYKNLKSVSKVSFHFATNRTKYSHIMYKSQPEFMEKLKSLLPLSCDYEKILSATAKKEDDMMNRLQLYCEKKGMSFTRNKTNGNPTDGYINNIRFQGKFVSFPIEDNKITYNISLHKNGGRFNGKHVNIPYSVNDPFEYLIVEVAGTKSEPKKYEGKFCIIPKQVLIDQGVLTTSASIGKFSIHIAPFDYHKDHWSKRFWDADIVPIVDS